MDNIGTQHSRMGWLWGSLTGLMGNSKKHALNETILASHERAKDSNGRLHLLGLVRGSPTAVSTLTSRFSKLRGSRACPSLTATSSVTPPTSAAGYASDLLSFTEKLPYGQLAMAVRWYYAMDRDERLERIKIAVDGREGRGGDQVNGNTGRLKGVGDTIFFFTYRSDRMRELVSVLGLPDRLMEGITTMSRYSGEFPFTALFLP
ncbi:BPG-independent [Mycena capillaripes]|nr:BPG-independent [Mycena capillaripes]KAJ6586175.1 BPG-independent [Mycena capillaripes]